MRGRKRGRITLPSRSWPASTNCVRCSPDEWTSLRRKSTTASFFKSADALLNTLLFLLRSERSARLPHQARLHCWHVLLALPWSLDHLESQGMAQMSSVELSNGQVGAVRGVQPTCWNTEGETEEGDRKSKNDDSSDTSGSSDTCEPESKDNKAIAYCLPRARSPLGHGSRQPA